MEGLAGVVAAGVGQQQKTSPIWVEVRKKQAGRALRSPREAQPQRPGKGKMKRRPHFAGFLPEREIGAWKVRTNFLSKSGMLPARLVDPLMSGVEGDKASRGLQPEPPCGDQKFWNQTLGIGGLDPFEPEACRP